MKKIFFLIIVFSFLFLFCGGQENDNAAEAKEESKILVVYFSRVGNTIFPNNVDASTSASVIYDDNDTVGTTEYVAKLIKEELNADIILIETADNYDADFNDLVDKNHREINENYFPSLKPLNIDIDEYDVVFIGYPVWANTVPRAILSFLREYDLTEKTVIPFCTHDGYGAGRSYGAIREAARNAAILDGLALDSSNIRGKENEIKSWLSKLNIRKISFNEANDNTKITITINNHKLDGIVYGDDLSKEILNIMPITVSMIGYGGREYYGGIDYNPTNIRRGELNFENGDITYCPQNNTLAIFYAQTERPNLTMEVIPIGKVLSDLSVFEDSYNGNLRRLNITFSLAN